MKNNFFTALIFLSCILNTYAENSDEHKFYLGIEATYSASMSANMDVSSVSSVSGAYFDVAANGYDSNLRQAFGYGILAGYNLSDIFALELAYNNRPLFKYERYQSFPYTPGDTTAVGNRTRYFDLQNQTAMLNGVIHLTSIFGVSRIEPFISLGVGFAGNTVTNFHTIGSADAPNNFDGTSYSQMTAKTVYKLAAQAGLGLDYSLSSRWKAKVGYRFIYGGNFESQNYVLDDPDYPSGIGLPYTGNSIAPWKGTLKNNEVYLGLTYSL